MKGMIKEFFSMLGCIAMSVFFALLIASGWVEAQVTFTSVGDIMFGSDGSTATTVGGTTFVHGASPLTYQALGMSVQNGLTTTTVEKIGEITFITNSGGEISTLQTIGNTTFINDGKNTFTVQKIGNLFFLNQGATK